MRKAILTVIIFLSLTGGVFYFGLPAFEQFKVINANIAQKEKDLADLEDYILHLQSVSGQLDNYAPQLAKIDQALLGSSYLPNAFEYIQKAASDSGARMDQLKFEKQIASEESKNIIGQKLSFSLSGQYQALKSFLMSVENSARLITVDGLSFSSSTPGAGASKQTNPAMQLNLSVFSYQN